MLIKTTRFGRLEIDLEDVLRFPAGLLGFEECREWVLLADADSPALAWLQSTTRADVALAVVSPRRFVPEYQFRVNRGELTALELQEARDAQVLVVVGRGERGLTLNLKAPIVLHAERRRGRQVIANDDLSVAHELPTSTTLRKTA